MDKIKQELLSLADEEYKNFHSALMPTVKKESILGVRVPKLRKYAKSLFENGDYKRFLRELPHTFYEENNLHVFLIEQIKDFNEAIIETERFLSYIDNWATCDMFTPNVFRKNRDFLFPYIEKWIKSGETYTVRYGVKLLMSLYLDEYFKEEHLELAGSACSSDYYVNMAVSWYFATALSKQEEATISYMKKKGKLSPWVHNKAIQKARESKRISPQMKEYLKSLKI